MRILLPAFLLVCAAVSPVSRARAESLQTAAPPVRQERRLLVGVAPVYPVAIGHDVTIPLPTLRVSVNLSPRLVVELTGGSLPYEANGRRTLIDAGVRWLLNERAFSPYLMAHAGDYFDHADEGNNRSYPFLAAGGGVEYASPSGLAAWIEAAPALVSYMDVGPRSLVGGFYMSLGIGYRIRTGS